LFRAKAFDCAIKPGSARFKHMAMFISHNPVETESLGERWGRDATRGLVIALSGDLGAGKTQLVKGVARGLGVTVRVHSPTFTLVNEYGGGRLKLFHLDLYRLETAAQIHSAGIEEFLQPDGVAVIEWAERLEDRGWKMEDGKVRKVRIGIISETERRIDYEDFGV
jgi:tRNA threonylcarbamoyladenosine biosynthesis protein TsaE